MEDLPTSSNDMTDWDLMHGRTSVPILTVAVDMNPLIVHVDTGTLPAPTSPVLVVSATSSS